MLVRRWLFRWSWREIREGDLLPVVVSLMLIVGTVFAVASLVDRLDRYLAIQHRAMLTADRVLESPHPFSESLEIQSRRKSLIFTDQLQFRTMVFSEQAMELVKVKAVDESYPLLGTLTLKNRAGEFSSSVQRGDVWISERLLSLLDVKPGDAITVGDAELVVSGVIAQDPEVSLNPFNQIPTVFVHRSSVPAIGAVQEGGRVTYYRYFVGPESILQALEKAMELQPGQRWVADWSGNQSDSMMMRARQYFSLTLILVVLMAAITLFLTGSHYADSRYLQVSTLKALGASHRWVLSRLLIQIGLLFVLGCMGGVIVGAAFESLLLYVLRSLLPVDLPALSFMPFGVSAGVALVVVLPCLGIPLLKLLSAPAAATLTDNHQSSLKARQWWLFVPAAVVLIMAVGDNQLVWYSIAGLCILFVLMGVIGVWLLKLKPLMATRSFSLTLALKRLRSVPARTGLQLAALTTTLLLMSVIWLIQNDLLNDWQQTIPADAPTIFAVNISPDETTSFMSALDDAQLEHSVMYPVVRGRLTHINEEAAQADKPEHERDQALRRELNFTFTPDLPDHNRLIDGEWQQENSVSVEAGLAERLNIKIGDLLTFVVNSQTFAVRVTSLRQVPWRSMKPNFYFIFSPDILQDLPATWMLSFKIDRAQDEQLNTLSRSFPTISMLDLRVLTQRALAILKQLSYALTLLASVSVVTGLLLIGTILRLSLHERKNEARIYRVLGASSTQIRHTLVVEFGLMGLLSGVLSVLGAELVMATLAYRVFEMPLTIHGFLWIGLPVLAVGLVMMIVSSFMKNISAAIAR